MYHEYAVKDTVFDFYIYHFHYILPLYMAMFRIRISYLSRLSFNLIFRSFLGSTYIFLYLAHNKKCTTIFINRGNARLYLEHQCSEVD